MVIHEAPFEKARLAMQALITEGYPVPVEHTPAYGLTLCRGVQLLDGWNRLPFSDTVHTLSEFARRMDVPNPVRSATTLARMLYIGQPEGFLVQREAMEHDWGTVIRNIGETLSIQFASQEALDYSIFMRQGMRLACQLHKQPDDHQLIWVATRYMMGEIAGLSPNPLADYLHEPPPPL